MTLNQCLTYVKNIGFNTYCNKEISQSFWIQNKKVSTWRLITQNENGICWASGIYYIYMKNSSKRSRIKILCLLSYLYHIFSIVLNFRSSKVVCMSVLYCACLIYSGLSASIDHHVFSVMCKLTSINFMKTIVKASFFLKLCRNSEGYNFSV